MEREGRRLEFCERCELVDIFVLGQIRVIVGPVRWDWIGLLVVVVGCWYGVFCGLLELDSYCEVTGSYCLWA